MELTKLEANLMVLHKGKLPSDLQWKLARIRFLEQKMKTLKAKLARLRKAEAEEEADEAHFQEMEAIVVKLAELRT